MSEILFKDGELVFYENPKESEFTGLYEFVSQEGDTCKLTNGGGMCIDVPKEHVQAITYSVFTRIPEGWPIVVPNYDKKSLRKFQESKLYEFLQKGTPEEMSHLVHKIEEELEAKKKG